VIILSHSKVTEAASGKPHNLARRAREMQAHFNLRSILVLVALAALISAAVLLSASCNPSSTATYTPVTLDQYSSTVISRYGLSITLSLNSTTYHPGEQISVTINEKNIFPIRNKIHGADKWPVEGLTLSPCGTHYPFGISILQGYYEAESIGTVSPLQLFDPNAFYSCPIVLAAIYYTFEPWSDTAAIYTGHGSEPYSTNMTAEVTASGFWTGSRPSATFSNFIPGIYTVVGGDEWGALVILHFTVV
jgi:hypothetical protein